MAEVGAKVQSVLERVGGGDIEGGARQFVEQVALGPGAWEQLPPAIRQTAIENAAAVVDELRGPDWAQIDQSALSSVSMPVLLTQGDQSPAWSFGIIAELARVMRHAEVHTFAGAGHAPHLTHPDDYVAAVTDRIAPARADRRCVLRAPSGEAEQRGSPAGEHDRS